MSRTGVEGPPLHPTLTEEDEVAQRSALALAERLGTTAVPLPGDHAGFLGDPEAFAAALRAVFAGATVS